MTLVSRKAFKRERKAYTREERRLMICQALAIEIQEGRGGYLTTAEIAHRLSVTPSTKLRIIINEMIVDGLLSYTDEKHASIAGFRRLYQLAPGNHRDQLKIAQRAAYGEPRRIKINSAQGVLWGEI